ncbi:MAG: methyltransferase domain-containing protein [archaeon]|nr:methyltransferase domain-containing protein [archaeon]
MDGKYFEFFDRSNSIEKYDFFLKNMGAETTLEKEVEKALQRKQTARILDIGCGEAQALSELKKKFGKQVHTIGIDLLDSGNPDEFIKGNAAEVNFPKDVDLAVSFRAMHLLHPLKKVFEASCKSLAPHGKAFFSVRCQQIAGGQLLFHGNLDSVDMSFLKQIAKEGKFCKAKIRAVEVKEPKEVMIIDPITGLKSRAILEILQGMNFFIEKE